ncbi:MAG: MBOAT family protein [Candidatus Melainabacteria bacterium]|nr:MBOAT family protein [Candidatus Melainabacteria bacterium]
MSWKPVYGLLILGLTLINYFFGLAIHHSNRNRKALLVVAIAANLVILGYFKYAYFTLDLANGMLAPTGAHLLAFPWEIILPLGISFFVFEFIHYISEVYKGGAPVKSFPAFALFASFFPTQIAGPIKRYQDFIPQLSLAKHFEMDKFEEGAHLILFGLFKKVLFADNLAVVVQSAFQHPYLLSSVDMWLAVYAFAFQIYFDFSGYTDIARGSALMLGFKVPPNFNLPYLAGSISEFWHRWHISLSTWLRDYLFIPLGGSKGSKLFNYRNLLITMILGGLWHGAAMHFVVWGAYQGVLLVLHKEYQRFTACIDWLAKVGTTKVFHIASVILTFHLVCLGWVFFRADTIKSALEILAKLCFLSGTSQTTSPWSLTIAATSNPVIFLLLPCVLILLFAGQLVGHWWSQLEQKPAFPKALKAVYMTIVVGLLLVFSPDTSPRFIYFQF